MLGLCRHNECWWSSHKRGGAVIVTTTDEYRVFRSAWYRAIELDIQDWRVQYATRIGTFKGSVGDDWRALEPLIAGIEALYVPEDCSSSNDDPNFKGSTYGRIARIEFVHSHDQFNVDRSGATVFDNRWNALFHVETALLGYEGSGVDLSRNILLAVGVPEELFVEANAAVASHSYDTLVFTREPVYHDDGIEFVLPNQPSLDTWTWFIV